MNELQLSLVSDAYAASPAQILEALPEDLTHRKPAAAPHSIYEELWHICFWQQVTLDWISGTETPFPASPADGFPTVEDMEREPWGSSAGGSLRARNAAQTPPAMNRGSTSPSAAPRARTIRCG